MITIHDELRTVEFGRPQTFKNLTMVPLLRKNPGKADYVILDEALAAGTARVTEVSDGGSVPELQFLNGGDVPVLLLDGEELVGAKQNRVLNLSILAPANTSITIPVSCVEAGRWSYRSSAFSSSPRGMYAKARAAKSQQVSMSLIEEGTRSSDQEAIWDDIAAKSARMSAASDTGAMSDIYEHYEQAIDDFVGRVQAIESQTGAMFSIENAIVGLDLFDSPDTLSKVLPKLVRSYALDSLELAEPFEDPVDGEMAKRFLADLAGSTFARFPAVGLGEDLRIQSRMVAGGALVADGRVVHLWAFPLKSEHDSENDKTLTETNCFPYS